MMYVISWPCQYDLVALVSLIQPASRIFTTPPPRISLLYSCPSFKNSPRPIPPTALSRRRNQNVLLATSGEYTKRTVPSICSTDHLPACKEHWRFQRRKVLQAGYQPYGTHCRTRFCSTQGRFQRRSVPKVWMATTTLAGKLCVWKTLHR